MLDDPRNQRVLISVTNEQAEVDNNGDKKCNYDYQGETYLIDNKFTSIAQGVSNMYLLLFVYSACGGMRTGRIMPVLTAYFPVLA